MKFAKLAGSALTLVAAFAVTACGSSSTPGSSSAASAPAAASAAPASAASAAPGSSAARTGTFVGANGKHVAGTATVAAGKIVLSGFSSDAGPDLHIYLANGSSESDIASGKQLGTISADQASQTFALGGVDPSKYSTVVIHCDKAKAVFGDAPLS